MQQLRVAMLSKWHVHAEEYARTLASFPDVKITCVWDEDARRGGDWAKELGVDFEPDLDKCLARKDVDAVAIDTPTCDHPKVMIAAANAGKHIFTEKALAATVAECQAIAEAIQRNGVKFCISYFQRTYRWFRYVKQMLDEGMLGQVSLLRIRNAHGGASQNWLPDYWYDAQKACGGAMMDLGCHPNYQAAYLLGKPARVTAMFNTLVCPPTMEDNAVSVIEFQNKAIAVLETGFVSPYSAYRFELMGTEGAIIVDGDKLQIRSTKLPLKGWFTPDISEMPEALPASLRQFVDGVLYDKPIAFGVEDGIALTQLLENAYIAHREQRIVAIP